MSVDSGGGACAATLCWHCRNAVPSPESGAGCSWSLGGTPVKGWKAQRRDIHGYKDGEWTPGVIESYRVQSCPEFRKG